MDNGSEMEGANEMETQSTERPEGTSAPGRFASPSEGKEAGSRRRIAVFASIAAAIVVVIAMGFVLLRLAGGAGLVSGSSFGGPTSIRAIPAKELPPRDPEAQGVILRRADNSLIIGTNFTKYQRNKNDDTGEVWYEIAFDGKPLEKEVVVTRETIIYGDYDGQECRSREWKDSTGRATRHAGRHS